MTSQQLSDALEKLSAASKLIDEAVTLMVESAKTDRQREEFARKMNKSARQRDRLK